MKILFIHLLILTVVSPSLVSAQSGYSFGIFSGAGVNIFRNNHSTDKEHFRFKNPVTAQLGIKLIRPLDDKNNFFAELMYSRKTIAFRYDLNEVDIPFSNRESISQKYDCISLYFGYRRVVEKYIHAFFFDASFGADYNSNVVVSQDGYGKATDEINGDVYFEGLINTNLGEKTYILSANVGLGVMFGTRNQYEIGAFVNIPLHKIQSESSQLDYRWNYINKQYIHQLDYSGQIYYPAVRLTYYVF